MNIRSFLDSLGDKLATLGVDDDNIKKHLYMFEKYLNSLGEDELTETLNDEDQLDIIAVNIYKLIKKKAAKSKLDDDGDTYSESASDDISPAPVDNSADIDDIGDEDIKLAPSDTVTAAAPAPAEAFAEDDSDMKTAAPASQETERAPEKTDDNVLSVPEVLTAADMPPASVSNEATRVIDAIPRHKSVEVDENAGTRVIDVVPRVENKPVEETSPELAGTKVIDTVKPPESEQPLNFDEFEDFTEDVPGSTKFWVLFFVTLPISLAVILIILALFAVLFAASAVLIVGLVAALIALVAGGTGVSLVGIIYGITQTVVTLPIGLYEIGLGVAIGGATMLCGILIYNFAVRLLPFLLRKLVSLLALIFDKLRQLFYRLKRESANS